MSLPPVKQPQHTPAGHGGACSTGSRARDHARSTIMRRTTATIATAGHEGHDHAGHDHAAPRAEAACCGHDHAAQPFTVSDAGAATLSAGPGQLLARLRIGQMDCPHRGTPLIRKKLDNLDGVHALDFNLMQRVLTVVHAEGALERILAAIRSLDMTPEPLADGAPRTPAPAARARSRLRGRPGGAGDAAQPCPNCRISRAGRWASPPPWRWPPFSPAASAPTARAGSPRHRQPQHQRAR